jgi:hypothetical protein
MKVVRTPDLCKEKRNHTQKNFKKMWDYEQNTPSGRSSFWTMTGSKDKSALKLNTIMLKQVYDQLCSKLASEFNAQNFIDTIV